MPTLHLALDWTPNANHTGFFVARDRGFYRDAGLDVVISDPSADNYARTPAKKLALGEVDFAIAPSESVISLNYKDAPVAARAIYAILREDLSSIATLREGAIARPRDLDGRTYASYGARYEDHIVRQLIRNDGGAGEPELIYPEKLGIWSTLLTGAADATWIFANWEGVEAATQGVELRQFRLRDYGIPYGYSPVVLATQERIENNREVYTRFVAATRAGFVYAAEHPAEATEILAAVVPAADRERIDLRRSQELTGAHYGTATTAGRMDPERVAQFLDWLVEHGIESERIKEVPLFTNALLG
jgi:ABC-type nitrate/sulfonate/bicarbonate transport system substrate-binding protein